MKPVAVPPPLVTSEPGSFARDTLARRVPEILENTRRGLGPVPGEVGAELDALDAELRRGRLRALRDPAPDRPVWDRAAAPHAGRSWLDLPWFFAEMFFYRRVLEATGYYGAGPLAGRDPWDAQKTREHAPDEAPRRVAEALGRAPGAPGARLAALVHASLWGNRADLSYNVAEQLGAHTGDAARDILVDDTAAVVAYVLARSLPRVVLVADNAGTELGMDLALCDHLLGACGVGRVDLHVKLHPTFVSDAIAADIGRALAALGASGSPDAAALAARVRGLLTGGRLGVAAPPFYGSPLFYRELARELPATAAAGEPAGDLRADLAAADLVIFKGDANYRRLCSDARWPLETPFAEVVEYFPAPLLALRTLKAEVLVGLAPGQAAIAGAGDPRWLTSGRCAVVQARLGG